MNQRPNFAVFPRTRERHASHCPNPLYEAPGPTTNHSPWFTHRVWNAAHRSSQTDIGPFVGTMGERLYAWRMAAERLVGLLYGDLLTHTS